MNKPVNPSVRPPVRHIFFTTLLPSLYHEIFNYSHWLKWCPCKSQGQNSKLKVTNVKTYFVPIWGFPDRNSSFSWQMATEWCWKLEVVWKRCPIVFQGHASNFKVTRVKNRRFWPQLGGFGLELLFKFTDGYKMIHKTWSGLETVSYFFEVIRQISGPHGAKNRWWHPTDFLCDKYDELRHTRNYAQGVNETQSEELKLKNKTMLNKMLQYAILWGLINPCNNSQETHPDVHMTMWCYQSSEHSNQTNYNERKWRDVEKISDFLWAVGSLYRACSALLIRQGFCLRCQASNRINGNTQNKYTYTDLVVCCTLLSVEFCQTCKWYSFHGFTVCLIFQLWNG